MEPAQRELFRAPLELGLLAIVLCLYAMLLNLAFEASRGLGMALAFSPLLVGTALFLYRGDRRRAKMLVPYSALIGTSGFWIFGLAAEVMPFALLTAMVLTLGPFAASHVARRLCYTYTALAYGAFFVLAAVNEGLQRIN